MHSQFTEQVGALLKGQKLDPVEIYTTLKPLISEEIERAGGLSSPYFSRIVALYTPASATRIGQLFSSQLQQQGFKVATLDELLKKAYRLPKHCEIDLTNHSRTGHRKASSIAFSSPVRVRQYVKSLYYLQETVLVARMYECEPFSTERF